MVGEKSTDGKLYCYVKRRKIFMTQLHDNMTQ